MEKQVYFKDKTPADKYLEYVNDWLTVERMAENYGYTTAQMIKIIDQGKKEHEINCARHKFQKTVSNKLTTINYSIKTAAERFSVQSMNKDLTDEDLLSLADDFINNNLSSILADRLSDQFINRNR